MLWEIVTLGKKLGKILNTKQLTHTVCKIMTAFFCWEQGAENKEGCVTCLQNNSKKTSARVRMKKLSKDFVNEVVQSHADF